MKQKPRWLQTSISFCFFLTKIEGYTGQLFGACLIIRNSFRKLAAKYDSLRAFSPEPNRKDSRKKRLQMFRNTFKCGADIRYYSNWWYFLSRIINNNTSWEGINYVWQQTVGTLFLSVALYWPAYMNRAFHTTWFCKSYWMLQCDNNTDASFRATCSTGQFGWLVTGDVGCR